MEQQERQHDGYIVPFDIKTWKLKEGEIILLGQKATNSYFLPHGGFVPNEIVETWEKHYPEQTEQTKPDYSKVIELIEGEIRDMAEMKEQRCANVDPKAAFTSEIIEKYLYGLKNKIKAL